MNITRLVTPEDAPALAALVRVNREFLAPWEPIRSAIVRVAFEELGLHRVQAETLLHNAGSQRVLERNGFVRYGMAPEYLNIAGRWQDHAMYQMVRPSSATG